MPSHKPMPSHHPPLSLLVVCLLLPFVFFKNQYAGFTKTGPYFLWQNSNWSWWWLEKFTTHFCPNFLHFPEPPSLVQKVWDFFVFLFGSLDEENGKKFFELCSSLDGGSTHAIAPECQEPTEKNFWSTSYLWDVLLSLSKVHVGTTQQPWEEGSRKKRQQHNPQNLNKNPKSTREGRRTELQWSCWGFGGHTVTQLFFLSWCCGIKTKIPRAPGKERERSCSEAAEASAATL